MKRREAFLFAVLLWVVSFALYLPLTALSTQDSDGAEYAAAAVTGSIVHQPGYPVFMALARLLVPLLDSDNPYHAMALFSAFSQSLAVALLFLVLCRVGVSTALSFLAALAWSLSAPVVKTATDAEVFAFHNLLLGGVLLSGLSIRNIPGIAIFGLLAGLAAAHHQTIVLWLPLFIYFVFNSECSVGWPKRFCVSGAAFLVGFSAYLTLLVIHNGAPILAFAPPENMTQLYNYILRTAYGSFSLTAGADVPTTSYLSHYLTNIGRSLPIAILGLVSIFFVFIFKFTAESFAWCAVGALHWVFLYLIILPADTTMHGEWASRFYGLASYAGVVLAGYVIKQFAPTTRLYGFLGLIIVLPLIFSVPKALEYGDARRDRISEYEIKQTLSEVPQNGIFIAATDRVSLGIVYFTQALKERPDVIVVVQGMLGGSRYREQLGIRDPLLKDLSSQQDVAFREIVTRAYEAGRGVFSNHGTQPPEGYRAIPLGVSWQWIKSEDLPERIEVTKRILAFCANWPDNLSSPTRTRASTRLIMGRLFIWPIKKHLPLVEDKEIAIILSNATDFFMKGRLSDARDICMEGLERLGESDPSLKPYR